MEDVKKLVADLQARLSRKSTAFEENIHGYMTGSLQEMQTTLQQMANLIAAERQKSAAYLADILEKTGETPEQCAERFAKKVATKQA